jgi:Putative hemolysin
MPLITSKELGELYPPLGGKIGQAFLDWAMRFFSMDAFNDVYDRLFDFKGPDFTDAFLKDQGIEYAVGGAEHLAELPDGPFITVSNHPFGHIDGITLVDLFGHIRPDFKVMVNKILARIKTLENNFITVIPTGRKRTAPEVDSIAGIRRALEHIRGGHPVGFFPSGAVSDLSLRECCIRDRQWQEPVLRLIQKAAVLVVPVRFFDRNSDFYYILGLISSAIRILRLPAEGLNKRGKLVHIGVGPVISPEKQAACGDARQLGKLLRAQCMTCRFLRLLLRGRRFWVVSSRSSLVVTAW